MSKSVVGGLRFFSLQTGYPCSVGCRRGGQERTIGRLWRDAVAREHHSPPYLAERDGGWEEVSWAAAATRVDELANGLLAQGVRKG